MAAARRGVMAELLDELKMPLFVTRTLLNELITNNNYSPFVYEHFVTRHGRVQEFKTACRRHYAR